jgi:hypothetical protein
VQNFKLTASMPCYGHPEETKRMIEQIVSQSFSGAEIFIVGDRCPEFQNLIDSGYMQHAAFRAARKGNLIHYWNEDINHGYWGTGITNMVIERAQGDYFLFLANDDIIAEDHFDHYYSAISNTRNDFVYFDSLLPGAQIRRSRVKKNYIGHSELIIKTSFLKRMPAHKPVYGQDWLLIRNMLSCGAWFKKSNLCITYQVCHIPSIETIRKYNPGLRRRIKNKIKKLLKFKFLSIAAIATITLFCAGSCKNKPVKEFKAPLKITEGHFIKRIEMMTRTQGDSVCGIPFFGCLHGVKLIDSSTQKNGDTITVKLYLKKVPHNKTISGVFYATQDQFVKMVFINDFMYEAFVGKPSGEDSLRFKEPAVRQ